MTPGFYLKQLELGPLANFVYLIGDPGARRCAVVDPAWDVAAIIKCARLDGFEIVKVFLTHGHPDHANGVQGLLAHADVQVYVHSGDARVLTWLLNDSLRSPVLRAPARGKPFGGNIKTVADGDKADLGGLVVSFIHTPGHTPGSQCLAVEGQLFTGDTLFVGGCGRVDLPGSDLRKMRESLRRICSLPDETVIWPGHNYADSPHSLLGEEKKSNPYLR